MNKVPDADNYLDSSEDFMDKHDIKKAMIIFAKKHVEAALTAASENAKTKQDWYQDNGNPDGFSYQSVDRESILTAYPLSNVK